MFRVLSVDIAGVGDWTALVGAEVHDSPTGGPPRTVRVPVLDRWHAPYTETARKVAAVANAPGWIDAIVCVDSTGVGAPVLESIRSALPGRVVYGITFTGGSSVTAGATPSDVRVPKKDLVGSAQVLFQSRRVQINPALKHADTLVRELVSYTVTITAAANETFDVGRQGKNDDLVCALAMVAWLAEKMPGPMPDARDLVLNVLPVDEPDQPDQPKSRLQLIAEDLDLFD